MVITISKIHAQNNVRYHIIQASMLYAYLAKLIAYIAKLRLALCVKRTIFCLIKIIQSIVNIAIFNL